MDSLIKAGSPSVGYVPPAPTFSLRSSVLGGARSRIVQPSIIDHDVRTFRRGGVDSTAITMKHDANPLVKRVAASLHPRSFPKDVAAEDAPSMGRRSVLGSALAVFLGAVSVKPDEVFAEIPQMSLGEAVKPPEARKTVWEPIDSTPLQLSYFQQFFDGLTWKGQTIRFDAKDASVHSHAISERQMAMVNNEVAETARFSNDQVAFKKVPNCKTYVKPSGEMLCLSTASLMEAPKSKIHFDKVMVDPNDPKSRIVLTPIYESASHGNYELTSILFAKECADGSTLKIEETWGLPIGHDMGLPVKGKWTKRIETINADYTVQITDTDYDRVAIPVHQDTFDRRVFALANEVIVALPATIGECSKGKTTHMDVLWTISDAAIMKSMFAFDKNGKFFQDKTELYARSG